MQAKFLNDQRISKEKLNSNWAKHILLSDLKVTQVHFFRQRAKQIK
jgi:hypothetical protein